MGRILLLIPWVLLAFALTLYPKAEGKKTSKDASIPIVLGKIKSPLADAFKVKTYKTPEGDSLRYLLFVPENYNPKKKYPVVLWLHGKSARGNNLETLLSWGEDYGPLFFARPENQKKHPCFIVVPQCPPGQLWAGPWGQPASPQLRLIIKTLKDVRMHYSIDARRRYVVGVSMGGFGAWDIIGRFPKTFAAAMPMCGGGYPLRALGLKDMAIWAFHGKADESVPPSRTREMVEAAKKSGAKVKYSEYKGVGHDVWERAFEEPKFLEWLFAQKRKS